MTKKFDPNAAAATDAGIFGLPFSEKESALVYLPVPWEATTSYGAGTSKGPQAIYKASPQLDLFDLEVEKPYEPGLYLQKESKRVREWNKEAKALAKKIIDVGGNIEGNKKLEKALARVNELSDKVNDFVFKESKTILNKNKILALIGGDHSTPFGAIKAVALKHKSFGILHFDAHSDTRKAYEGFTYSHASIMYNILENIPEVKKLVQVGIRDFCEEEYAYTQNPRVKTFFDLDIQKRKLSGESWQKITNNIIQHLPENVWISFDIDGLDPRFCPHTGTPVPGGLDFNEANFIIGEVVKSGKKIIGFDLNEVAPNPSGKDEWDANVGARLLYKLTAWTLASQGLCRILS